MSLDPEFATLPTTDALTELIFAGNDLARMQLEPIGRTSLTRCKACQIVTNLPADPKQHRNLCPVARYYGEVEAVKGAAA